MKVLSLFDGMGRGLTALKRAKIPVSEYHAFEIDKYAIKVAMENHPEIIQHGEISFITDFRKFKDVDMLIGGSPCQGFSFAGKGLNFEDPRSALFFEFVRAKNEIKPKYFLLENVKMKKEHLDVISENMNVQPVLINSALVSAQNRNRYYWCNWKVGQPTDRGILLKDIIETTFNKEEELFRDKSKTIRVGGLTSMPTERQNWTNIYNNKLIKIGNVNPSGKGMNGEIYSIEGKAPTVTTNKGEGSKIGSLESVYAASQRGRHLVDGKRIDILGAPTEQRIETVLSEKSNCLSTVQKDSLILRVPEATKKGYVEINPNEGVDLTYPSSSTTRRGRRMEDKSNCLTAAPFDYNWYNGFTWRKLTPIECERLQTLPDNYTHTQFLTLNATKCSATVGLLML